MWEHPKWPLKKNKKWQQPQRICPGAPKSKGIKDGEPSKKRDYVRRSVLLMAEGLLQVRGSKEQRGAGFGINGLSSVPPPPPPLPCTVRPRRLPTGSSFMAFLSDSLCPEPAPPPPPPPHGPSWPLPQVNDTHIEENRCMFLNKDCADLALPYGGSSVGPHAEPSS